MQDGGMAGILHQTLVFPLLVQTPNHSREKKKKNTSLYLLWYFLYQEENWSCNSDTCV